MRRFSIPVVFLIAALTKAAAAHADIVAQSTFTGNGDNWSAGFGAQLSVPYFAGDGNPAGSLRTSDRPDVQFTWYFFSSNVPGTTFYGNMSAAYGGTISYDLKRLVDPGAEYYTEAGATVYDIRLNGLIDADMNGSLETALTLGFSSPTLTPATTGLWQSMSVPLLSSAGWFRDLPSGVDPAATEAQLLGVLTNLRQIEIRGNYSTPIGDSTGLDNVALNAVAVPEAPAWAIWCVLVPVAATLWSFRRSIASRKRIVRA
jgi:hypothetical protein